MFFSRPAKLILFQRNAVLTPPALKTIVSYSFMIYLVLEDVFGLQNQNICNFRFRFGTGCGYGCFWSLRNLIFRLYRFYDCSEFRSMFVSWFLCRTPRFLIYLFILVCFVSNHDKREKRNYKHNFRNCWLMWYFFTND